MFYYPKPFTFKSILTSQEVFTNVARFVLFKKTNTPNIGDLIAEALASMIFNNNNIHYYQPVNCAIAVLFT